MRGFEVYVNEKFVCVAGFPGDGLLLACVQHLEEASETSLRVLGSPHTVQEHLHFTDHTKLKVGDEVRVRIVETAEPSEPIQRVDVTPPQRSK